MVLLIQCLGGGESIRFNPLQVIWLSLKLNGQSLRGETEGPGIPSALLRAAPSPDLGFMPHPESHGVVLSFRVFLSAVYTLSARNYCFLHLLASCFQTMEGTSVLRLAPFRKGSSYSGEVVARMKCCEECLHCVLMKRNYSVLFKNKQTNENPNPQAPYLSL